MLVRVDINKYKRLLSNNTKRTYAIDLLCQSLVESENRDHKDTYTVTLTLVVRSKTGNMVLVDSEGVVRTKIIHVSSNQHKGYMNMMYALKHHTIENVIRQGAEVTKVLSQSMLAPSNIRIVPETKEVFVDFELFIYTPMFTKLNLAQSIHNVFSLRANRDTYLTEDSKMYLSKINLTRE